MLRKVPTALNNQVVVAVCRLFPQWTTEAIHRYNSQWIFPWEYISVAICCGARSVLLSAELPLLDIKLPFWIYGRNLIFLDAYYLLAETVEAHTWNPITSRLINIHTGESASLGDWYNNVKVKANCVELKNDFTGETMILKDVKKLNWV